MAKKSNEIEPLNEQLYLGLSIEELEKRLEMQIISAGEAGWCGSHCSDKAELCTSKQEVSK